MNRLHHLLLFLAILLAVPATRPFPAFGQSLPGDSSDTDSLLVDSLASFDPVPFNYLPIEDCGAFLIPHGQSYLLLQDSAAFADLLEPKRFIGQCKEMEIPQIDFSRYAVFGFDLFADCNARIGISVVRDTAARTYKVVVDTYYGGCRGMRSHSYWLLIPALKEGETVTMGGRDYERREGREW